ncbi:hypothetical protein SPBR_06058 [Sporothrix brasiliensis 5110]|uniref:Short-chain dehydrogenase n=1 Tax=Sporothrix brasiliensis 5110 TaxID=1398154 RepID=A0A0C2FSI3_9PEZI|nr:uncharacterized protein SPBR_06058 [Sporothrix brasiliensis 5110]KIH93988.1 hypothetical protein SPBR_06058 [Sporothrix brasiliensis 5110]
MSGTVATADLNKLDVGAASTATSDEIAAQLHDHMVGKTVLITGVSPSGLGAEAARIVAAHAPKLLILASRSPDAIAEVIASLKADAGFDAAKTAIEPLPLDLASQPSVRAAAADLTARHPDLALDVLINNAGIMMLQTYQGVPDAAGKLVEKQFATNHIGPFLLTNLLVPALRRSTAAGGARVVSVMSGGYLGSPVRALDDPSVLDDTPANRAAYDAFAAYAQSKTAGMLLTVGLAQKLAGKGVEAFSVNPGAVGTTGLGRYVPEAVQKSLGWLLEDGSLNPAAPFISAAQSVASYVTAAYDPALAGQSGATISSSAVDTGILDYAKDPELAARLWTLSETLVGETFDY